jgi:hypothetical protein
MSGSKHQNGDNDKLHESGSIFHHLSLLCMNPIIEFIIFPSQTAPSQTAGGGGAALS